MKVVLCELYELKDITFDLRIVKREAEKKLRLKSSGPRQELAQNYVRPVRLPA